MAALPLKAGRGFEAYAAKTVMKMIWIFCAAAGFLVACGDNDVGNRTYDLKTPVDSANYPLGSVQDTTPTTNNNIYNPDSMQGMGTPAHKGSGQVNQPLQPLQQ